MVESRASEQHHRQVGRLTLPDSALHGFALFGLSMCNHNEALVRLLDGSEGPPPRAENSGRF